MNHILKFHFSKGAFVNKERIKSDASSDSYWNASYPQRKGNFEDGKNDYCEVNLFLLYSSRKVKNFLFRLVNHNLIDGSVSINDFGS